MRGGSCPVKVKVDSIHIEYINIKFVNLELCKILMGNK